MIPYEVTFFNPTTPSMTPTFLFFPKFCRYSSYVKYVFKMIHKCVQSAYFSILRVPFEVTLFDPATPSMTSISCPNIVGTVLMPIDFQNYIKRCLFDITFNFNGTLWSNTF